MINEVTRYRHRNTMRGVKAHPLDLCGATGWLCSVMNLFLKKNSTISVPQRYEFMKNIPCFFGSLQANSQANHNIFV